jgi:hypothetical protein
LPSFLTVLSSLALAQSQRPQPLSRAALSEEAEFKRAIAASLAGAEVDEDDHDAQEDSPTMEELRRRRMARFA